jgi:hypothetical protein
MITINDPPAVAAIERPAAWPLKTPSPSHPEDAGLRTRLRWVALVMLMTYGIALIWVLATRDDLHQPLIVLVGLRVTLAMIVLGLLFGELSTSLSHLRLFGLALFGGLTVCLSLSDYLLGRDWIRTGELPRFLAQEKDSLIELLILMVAYGLLLPERARVRALVILTMGLAPFLALTVLLFSEPASPAVLAELCSIEHVGQNALIVLAGAGLAICGSRPLASRGALRGAGSLLHRPSLREPAGI